MPRTDGRPAERADTGETRQERINRELIELLNELRVALPGVQFLFAFLLIVPFSQTVDRTTDFQRDVHYVALLAAAVATALLIAPAAQHRVLFRQHDKEALLRRSSCSLSFCRNRMRCWAAGAMSSTVATAAASRATK